MLNFTFYNPTKVIFGKGTIPEVKNLILEQAKGHAGFRSRSKPTVFDKAFDATIIES